MKRLSRLTIMAFLILIPAILNAGEYNRKDWPHWIDTDRDCQSTRTEVLIKDSRSEVIFKNINQCVVISGVWTCPYTGRTYYSPSDIDIDHIVPLANAHRSGAENWPRSKKQAFANDLENLLSVEDNINQNKSDQGPEDWKPPLTSYWKNYAKCWIFIKEKYKLKYAPGELEALGEMLKTD